MGIYQILHPPVYQGHNKKKNYFEGWYYKQVSSNYRQVLAIIPGISRTESPHAFIQLIDGKSGKSHYIRFDHKDFSADTKQLKVQIGQNIFTQEGLTLAIKQADLSVEGKLSFKNQIKWPVSLSAPGIMGWYRYVPFMECYHGVVAANQSIDGSIQLNDTIYNFHQGYGYIEKDWGSSFPECWIWLHANCFEEKETAVMLSIAKIPWMGNFFVGFLCFVYHQGSLYRFLTYNRSKIVEASLLNTAFKITFANRTHQVTIEAQQNIAGKLKAPVLGKMDRVIKESIDSDVTISLSAKNDRSVFKGSSKQAGLEIVGDVISLL